MRITRACFHPFLPVQVPRRAGRVKVDATCLLTMKTDDRTTVIQSWIDRLRAGDGSARESLLGCACDRLALLTRRMLRGFPGVQRWEQTDDVLQNSLVRLDRALKSVAPTTTQDFFRLATTQIRRELIDLARRYSGPEGLGAHRQSQADKHAGGGTSRPAAELSDLTHEPSRLAVWTEFHQQVADLPEEDREAFELLWYQGLTQAEAAGVLGISERTVSRRWISARLKINNLLGGRLPN
jgi:RNA polymerase sigma factor (sigma-70 family)